MAAQKSIRKSKFFRRSRLLWQFGFQKAESKFLRWVRQSGRERPKRFRQQIRFLKYFAPSSPTVRQAECLLTARIDGWRASAPLVQRCAAEDGQNRLGPSALVTALLPEPQDPPCIALALPVQDRDALLKPEVGARIVVYTVGFGGTPHLPPLFGMPPGVRFICFTDASVSAPGWEVVPTDPRVEPLAFFKICPHEVLSTIAPEAEWSLFLDPGRIVVGNLHTLFSRWLLPLEFALWRHPTCGDWHDLVERAVLTSDAGPALNQILDQAATCEREVTPRNRGALDTGTLWRRHTSGAVKETMKAWWSAHAQAPGSTDISMYRTLHQRGGAPVSPAVMPAALGHAHRNIFFADDQRSFGTPRSLPRAGSKLPVAFLYSTKTPNSAVTVLRGKQLSEMVSEAHSDVYEISYVSDIEALRNCVVIVTKEALLHNTAEALCRLRSRNIAVIGAWEDGIPEREKVAHLDAHMTLSIPQMLELNQLYPKTPAFHVTHHVNRQVLPSAPPMDRLRTGYFGASFNTVRPDSLSSVVDIVGLNAMRVDDDWLTKLPNYNCHWIVRNRQRWDGWKPFLKGFVAARCGAVVIVTRDDSNAPYYLGDDYPFYAESVEPKELEMAWIRVAAAFGGADWRLANDIMKQVAARSTEAQVCIEFKSMLDEVVG